MRNKKGMIRWNKGLTKETDERIRKAGEKVSKTRKRLFKEGKLKLSSTCFKKGHISANKGKTKENYEPLKRISGAQKKIRKGKTFEQLFGEDKAREWKNNLSKSRQGKNHPRYGIILGKKLREKISKSVKEEWKNISNKERQKRLKQFADARKKLITPKEDTKIEKKIQRFLKKLKIEFFTHQYMKIEHGYQCDILIPSMNLVIECDGDYWHKYPIGNDIDHIRTSELLKKGFNVLRLWENEIKAMGVDDFKYKLKEMKNEI